VTVPLSYVTLNVKKGTASKPGGFETTTYSVKITDTACKSAAVPEDAFAANLEHLQTTSTEGHLTYPFQPFGKYELCLAGPSNRLYEAAYENKTVEGNKLTIYPEKLKKKPKANPQKRNVKPKKQHRPQNAKPAKKKKKNAAIPSELGNTANARPRSPYHKY